MRAHCKNMCILPIIPKKKKFHISIIMQKIKQA